jgi:hypothetical protein
VRQLMRKQHGALMTTYYLLRCSIDSDVQRHHSGGHRCQHQSSSTVAAAKCVPESGSVGVAATAVSAAGCGASVARAPASSTAG